MISRDQIVRWLERSAAVLEANKEHLTELDAAIGDADHGANMHRGFKKVVGQISADASDDIGGVLRTASMALISGVGGASGPLYGTFFQRAAKVAADKHQLSGEELADLLQAGLDGVIQRGRAKPGDKTMVDALVPAVKALKRALRDDADVPEALQRCVEAARQGMQETTPMVAQKGRASYMGQRSAGHQDPGATSSYLILKALQESLSE